MKTELACGRQTATENEGLSHTVSMPGIETKSSPRRCQEEEGERDDLLWSSNKLPFFLLIARLSFSTDAKRCHFAPYYDKNLLSGLCQVAQVWQILKIWLHLMPSSLWICLVHSKTHLQLLSRVGRKTPLDLTWQTAYNNPTTWKEQREPLRLFGVLEKTTQTLADFACGKTFAKVWIKLE